MLCELYQVLPLDEIALFDVSELELVLCGVPALDIEDWRAHTGYKSGEQTACFLNAVHY